MTGLDTNFRAKLILLFELSSPFEGELGGFPCRDRQTEPATWPGSPRPPRRPVQFNGLTVGKMFRRSSSLQRFLNAPVLPVHQTQNSELFSLDKICFLRKQACIWLIVCVKPNPCSSISSTQVALFLTSHGKPQPVEGVCMSRKLQCPGNLLKIGLWLFGSLTILV